MRVALATFDPALTGFAQRVVDLAYGEDAALASALAAEGVEAGAIPWTRPDVDWGGFPLVVVRTTWGYDLDRAAFLAWVDRVAAATRLLNPAPILRWNTDKSYLVDLARAGVPVPPTLHLRRGGRVDLASILRDRGWEEAVVKRTVTAGARGQARVRRAEAGEGQRHLERLLTEGDALIQPYLHSVARTGERSLVFFNGIFSHAVAKIPAPGNYVAHPGHGAATRAHRPTAAELAVAEAALKAAPGSVLHARVDLVDLEDGGPGIMELELVEPFLFLQDAPGAARRLARAIWSAATPRPSSAAGGSS